MVLLFFLWWMYMYYSSFLSLSLSFSLLPAYWSSLSSPTSIALTYILSLSLFAYTYMYRFFMMTSLYIRRHSSTTSTPLLHHADDERRGEEEEGEDWGWWLYSLSSLKESYAISIVCSNKDTMDSRYHFSSNMPNRYEQLSNQSNSSHINNGNRLTPTSSRYFHRAPLIFPHHHQQRLRSPPTPFSSSYLGPLHQHRPRFLSAWDLTPTPSIYLSSRNIATTTPTPTSVPNQPDEGACILNSCAFDFCVFRF